MPMPIGPTVTPAPQLSTVTGGVVGRVSDGSGRVGSSDEGSGLFGLVGWVGFGVPGGVGFGVCVGLAAFVDAFGPVELLLPGFDGPVRFLVDDEPPGWLGCCEFDPDGGAVHTGHGTGPSESVAALLRQLQPCSAFRACARVYAALSSLAEVMTRSRTG